MSEIIEKARELNSVKGMLENRGINWTRIKSRQMWISQLLDSRYILIKSYSTIVGMVDTDERKVYEFGKYSPTTSKQMTQLCREQFYLYDRELLQRPDVDIRAY